MTQYILSKYRNWLVYVCLIALVKPSIARESNSGSIKFRSKADSLLSEIANLSDNKVKVKAYEKLATLFEEQNVDSAHFYAKTGFDLAKELNDINITASAVNKLAFTFMRRSQYSLAQNYLQSVFKSQENIFNPSIIAEAHTIMASVFIRQSKFEKAIDHYLKALRIYKRLDGKEKIAAVYISLTEPYFRLKSVKNAEYYCQKGLRLIKEIGTKDQIASSLNNVGIILKRQRGKKAKALSYFNQALEIRKELGDSLKMGIVWNNIAGLWYRDSCYDDALIYQKKAQRIAEKYDEKIGIARTTIGLGYVYHHLKNYPQAIAFTKKGLMIAKEIRAYDQMRWGYDVLRIIYLELGDFNNAYKSYHSFYSIIKEIHSREKFLIAEDLKAKYENEKKDLLIAQKEKDVAERDLWIIILTIIAGVITYFLHKFNRQNLIIEAQKHKINNSKKALEIWNKRLRYSLNHDVLHTISRHQTLLLSTINSGSHDMTAKLTQQIYHMSDLNNHLYSGSIGSEEIPLIPQIDGIIELSLAANDKDKVRVEKIIPDISLNYSIVSILELVINEVITNACKHAFSSAKSHTLTVEISVEQDLLKLQIIDNGPGYEDDFDISSRTSGQLIHLNKLMQSLGAKVQFSNNKNGAVFTLENLKLDRYEFA